MKSILKLGIATILGCFTMSATAGIIVQESAIGVLSSQESGVSIIDFEDGLCGYASCSGDYQVRLNSDGSVNQSAPPFQATPIGERWLTVPNPQSNGSASFGLGGSYDYFGLFWGSIDSYNTLGFYNNNALVGDFTGSDLAPLLADGNQTAWSSNRYINFYFTDGDVFDEVRLTSTRFAFETDNHAFGNVPEPSVLALFAAGLFGIRFARRKA